MAEPVSTSSPGDRRLDDLRAEVWRVEALGQKLRPEDWDRASRCEAWTISDVFAHLTVDFDRYLAWLGDARGGASDPPFHGGALAADNALRLDRYADVPGPDRLLAFEAAAGGYLREVAGADPDLKQGNPLGTMTVGEQVVWATIECAIHGWDVATPLGLPWPAPSSIDALVDVWRHRRLDPLTGDDPWEAMLLASGREP